MTLLQTRQWIGAGFGVALFASGCALAQAKTCTVDLDDLKRVRREASLMLHDGLRVDRNRAKALRNKYLDGLKTGEIDFDPRDLEGVISGRPKLSKELVQELLAEIEKIVETCDQ